MKTRLRLIACLSGFLALACNPTTSRPGFRPLTLATIDTANTDPPTTLSAIESQITDRGLPVRRSSARDGYLETRGFDVETNRASGADIHDPLRVVILRFWVNPMPGGRSQIVSEVVFRRTADPSISDRAAETMVPPDHPARDLLADVLATVRADGRVE